jgi:hypothetical protein
MENLMVYGQLDIACTSIANKKHQVNLTDLDFTFSETFEPGWMIFDIYICEISLDDCIENSVEVELHIGLEYASIRIQNRQFWVKGLKVKLGNKIIYPS